jgi:zinc protease
VTLTATVKARRALLLATGVLLSTAAGGPSCTALRGRPTATSGAGATAPPPPSGAQAITEATLGTLAVRLWRLDNGLRVITVPDPAARAVSVVTTFRVGSRDERPVAGEVGLAHLFEHLMFTGAPAPGAPDFDQQMEEVGGTCNAETSADATTYVDEVPPEALDRILRLEAGRMRGLEVTDAKVANERKIVIEERLATVEDSVDGTLEELAWRQSFRAHPYQRSIIGTVDDIKAITRAHAQAFYRRHYTPDRAVVVVAGKFDEAGALATIVSSYGGVAAGAAPPEEAAPPPEQGPESEVRATLDRPVPADRLLLAFPAPAWGGPDRAAYEVLAEALVGGPASRLARQLIVERAIASSLTGEVAPTRDPGLWLVWVQLQKGHAAREAEDAIVTELAGAAAAGLSETELTAAARRLETAFWLELTASRGRAQALAQFEVVTGDFRNLLARGSAYAKVTVEDLRRVAATYFSGGARSVVVASRGGGRS